MLHFQNFSQKKCMKLVKFNHSYTIWGSKSKEFCNRGHGLSSASLRRLQVTPPLQTSLVFHQKSKIYDVVCLMFLWWVKKPVLSMNCWHGWLLLKTTSSQPCQYFMERTGFLAQQTYRRLTKSWIFDGKQHPKNIWFHRC